MTQQVVRFVGLHGGVICWVRGQLGPCWLRCQETFTALPRHPLSKAPKPQAFTRGPSHLPSPIRTLTECDQSGSGRGNRIIAVIPGWSLLDRSASCRHVRCSVHVSHACATLKANTRSCSNVSNSRQDEAKLRECFTLCLLKRVHLIGA